MSRTYNPYEAPETGFTEADSEQQDYELATITERVLARVIDEVILIFSYVLYLIVLGIGALIIGAFTAYQSWLDEDLTFFTLNLFDPTIWIDIFVIHGLFLALNGVLLHQYGQTIGKRLLKIAMVDADTYERVPVPRLLVLRYVIWSIPNLFFIVVWLIVGLVDLGFGLRKNRRTLHDMTANTIVVKVNRLATSRRYL